MKKSCDSRPVALELGQDLPAHAHARKTGVQVGGVFVGDDAPLVEKFAELAPPRAQKRTDVMPAPRRHAAKSRKAAAPQHVQRDAFDQVVGGVGDRDGISARVDFRAFEERVAQLARRSLQRALRERLRAPLGDQPNVEARAEVGDMKRNQVGALAKSVVVMRGDEVVPGLVQGDQEGGRVRSAGHRDHGGAGWTRTSDNAIMSRALYHLSYGTAERS